MKDKPPKNLPASVRQRLTNQANARQRAFSEILQYYAIERFLYRLAQSPYNARFVLKGALVFAAWGSPLSRPTRDIDLLGFASNTVEALVGIMREVCAYPVEPDGAVFDISALHGEQIKAHDEYVGVRLHMMAYIERARISLQLDVGFADAVWPPPQLLDYPTLLDMPAPRLRGYPREAVVAEKTEAMLSLGNTNSRMKDFYDLWVLAHNFEFEGPVLLQSLIATCTRRATELRDEQPVGLSDEFARAHQPQWAAFLRTAKLTDVPHDLGMVHVELRTFLNPPIQAGARGTPLAAHWPNGGPWQTQTGA